MLSQFYSRKFTKFKHFYSAKLSVRIIQMHWKCVDAVVIGEWGLHFHPTTPWDQFEIHNFNFPLPLPESRENRVGKPWPTVVIHSLEFWRVPSDLKIQDRNRNPELSNPKLPRDETERHHFIFSNPHAHTSSCHDFLEDPLSQQVPSRYLAESSISCLTFRNPTLPYGSYQAGTGNGPPPPRTFTINTFTLGFPPPKSESRDARDWFPPWFEISDLCSNCFIFSGETTGAESDWVPGECGTESTWVDFSRWWTTGWWVMLVDTFFW